MARDDAAVLREFGVDVAQMRRQLESTFGALAVHEAERRIRVVRGGAAGVGIVHYVGRRI